MKVYMMIFQNVFQIIISDRDGISLMYILLQQDGDELLENVSLGQLYHCCDKHIATASLIMLVTIICLIYV